MRRLAALAAALAALGTLPGGAALAETRSYAQRPDVQAFMRDMRERHGFVERELAFLFERARRRNAILKAIVPPKTPRERSWAAYRQRFVNAQRIEAGAAFWAAHQPALERMRQAYGIPEEIVVAIIGVETFYGRYTGEHRVIDALTTLAFDYPPRAAFFRSELEHYLLHARDTGIDVFDVRGSYAGAIGIPQFMPGSYRRYAVDFDGDGIADLRESVSDAIGSVANYLREHGWRSGEPVWLPAQVAGEAHRGMLEAGIEPRIALGELRRYGVETRSNLPLDTPVALIDLPSPGGPTEYRLGLRNFYVITRYNRSSLYASAVADLAVALRRATAR